MPHARRPKPAHLLLKALLLLAPLAQQLNSALLAQFGLQLRLQARALLQQALLDALRNALLAERRRNLELDLSPHRL